MKSIAFVALVAAGVLAAGAEPASAAGYRKALEPTAGSSAGLVDLDRRLTAPALDGVSGIPVKDVHWTDESLDVHLVAGTLFVEPDVAGGAGGATAEGSAAAAGTRRASVGAYFQGEAKLSYAPRHVGTRGALRRWFGGESVTEPVSEILFFSLRGREVAAELGVEGRPGVPLARADGYRDLKGAFAQLGTRALHAFLNRDGWSRGASFVIFNAPRLRARGSGDAFLMYSVEPGHENPVQLSSIGHEQLAESSPRRMTWRTLAWESMRQERRGGSGRVDEYLVEVRHGWWADTAEEKTTAFVVPAAGVSALKFALTTELVVQSVRATDGAPLPFLQWKHRPADPNFDRHVLVSFGRELPPGEEVLVTFETKGRLFEPAGLGTHYLRDEDTWYPRLNEGRCRYDITLEVPPGRLGTAPGELVEDERKDDAWRRRFRTRRPQSNATIYFGDYVVAEGLAGATKVQVYGDRRNGKVRANLDHVRTEIVNMVEVYNRLFVPLPPGDLRVVGTPTTWGRGFEGMVLVGQRGGFDASTSESDMFRAHEIAHQWWGNMVEPELREDRWLSESFAEYAAFEYYRHRFPNDARVVDRLAAWARPVFEAPTVTQVRLTGGEEKVRASEAEPLLHGGENVYTKGPLVLHMLRAMFRNATGNDDAFWRMLREFLELHANEPVTTGAFMAHAEPALGTGLGWFREQWLERGEIPVVNWSYTLEPRDGKVLVTVTAEQERTDFQVAVPVHLHFKDGRQVVRPLALKGPRGQLQLSLTERPTRVTLNDYLEALVLARQRR